jgi:hypothetical protein
VNSTVAKTFFTVGGSAAGVWIFCLVVGAVFPAHAITPLSYRIIAITLSEVIALVMVFRLKSRKAENWFLSIFNGLLIFINASGCNVITANTFFSDKTGPEKSTGLVPGHTHAHVAGFFDSFHQIQWWQDNATFKNNIALAKENDALKAQVAELKDKPSSMPESNLAPAGDSVRKLATRCDSLLLVIQSKELKIRELSMAQPAMKTNSGTVVVHQDTSVTNKLNLIQSYGALMKNYQVQLKKCDEYNQELISKIGILQRELAKCTGSQNTN